MARVDRRTVVKHLSKLEPDEIQAELLRLYDTFPQVRNWYKEELEEGKSKLLEQVKKRVTLAYFPKKGSGKRRNAVCRKLLSEYRKVAAFDTDMIDLLLHRVEQGVKAAKKPGKRYENYFSALLISWEEAQQLIGRNQLQKDYKKRLDALQKKAKDMPYELQDKLKSTRKKWDS